MMNWTSKTFQNNRKKYLEMKNIQISEELFIRLYRYHLLGQKDALQEQIIKDLLAEKFDRIQKRNEYAISLTTKEQERSRSCNSF